MNVPECCQRHLQADPHEGDLVHCPCGLLWVARTAPHVGVPTWWSAAPARDVVTV